MDHRPSRLLAPEYRRRIGQQTTRGEVVVGDTDASATLGNPQASLRDGSVETIVSGVRHGEKVFRKGVYVLNGRIRIRFERKCFESEC